ncbi:hypothetical protein NLU13_7637 [Sarocladium strictum]|uniref:Transcription initiation factor IIE subunit beta n=1 Tax=Sarocladium strictum TaxID=5046 RepID=A0AA39L604_SARSR|nr:hypothetical protein NLU13_7637 [Sarocladium strictum]
MSSYLEKQSSAFKGTLASAASKLSNPSTKSSAKPSAATTKLAPPSPSPSAPSEANTPSAKRKREAAPDVPFSQPSLTGYGQDLKTNMAFAVDYLKQKRQPKTIADIIDHLSLRVSDHHKRELTEGLRRHPRVDWRPDPTLAEQTWQTGLYSHRPIIPGVKDPVSLLAHLQRKTDASGVSVKDLKDGWPDCEPTLAEMEKEHKILVVRTKKDNTARYVWADDPSLHHHVEDEFTTLWERMKLPPVEEMHGRLVKVGQKPTGDDPKKIIAQATKPKQQKKRAGKRIGKATNVHMQHLMQDYSDRRR